MNPIERATETQRAILDLPEDFRTQLIEQARGQATRMQELVNSGRAKNYDEALHMLPSVFPEYPEMNIKLDTVDHGMALVKTESNGDYYLHLGNGEPQFLGNADEGVYSEVSGMLNIDLKRQEENVGKIFDTLNLLKHAGGNA